MSHDNLLSQERLCVVTLVETAQDLQDARLLLHSLRRFGGPLGQAPVWLFFLPGFQASELSSLFASIGKTQLILLDMHPAGPGGDYPFASKVYACAQAEALAGPQVRTLVWFNPGCLVLNPPSHFDLAPSFDAAFRPVHHRNIGSLAQEPLDDYWQAVYRQVSLDEAPYTVESFADAQTLRPYLNTHCFSIDPALGLFTAWQEHFHALVTDSAFQSVPCRDPLKRIFLHQTVLSALLAKRLPPERLHLLPPGYSYPLHLHPQVPIDRRPARLNDLVCPVYEDAFAYPATLNGLPVDDPLRSWLQKHTD